jgi:hypothetical protein
VISDASVVRNFAVLGWTDCLCTLCGGTILVAEGVIGAAPGDPGEIESAKEYFDMEAERASLGSRAQTDALAASRGLADLLARRSTDVVVVTLTPAELNLALRLQDTAERPWREGLGMKARRLDAGEAACIAIAVTRALALATDDGDGVVAFKALGGTDHSWTRDLLKRAVKDGLLGEAEAKAGYEELQSQFNFRAPPW